MNATIVRAGKHIINIEHVADAKWENGTLYIHFIGGRFASFSGKHAVLIWDAIKLCSLDLETGEVNESP